MENEEMKPCPYCAEPIRKNAIKCRYCGSMLESKNVRLDFLSTPGYWHRVQEGKKVAGVCTGIAKQLESPVLILPLRLFFILTSVFYFFGPILYIVLWVLMPPPTDATSARGTRRPSGRQKPPAPAPPSPKAFDLDVKDGTAPAHDKGTPVDIDAAPKDDAQEAAEDEPASEGSATDSTVETSVAADAESKEKNDWEIYGPKEDAAPVETISLDDDDDDDDKGAPAGNGPENAADSADESDAASDADDTAGEIRDDGTVKMIGMKKGVVSIVLVVLTMIAGYLIVLNGMLDITISPFVLIAGLMFAALPLAATLFALRLDMIKTVSTGI